MRYVKPPERAGRVLRLVNDHYQCIETERRGIAESMRLMADEARALEHAAANRVSNARNLTGELRRRGCKFALGDFGIGVDFAQGIFLAHPLPIAQLPK